jgi:hypothetical protein
MADVDLLARLRVTESLLTGDRTTTVARKKLGEHGG